VEEEKVRRKEEEVKWRWKIKEGSVLPLFGCFSHLYHATY